MDSKLNLVRRAARVLRCHIMPPIHPQTVGEHTFGVIAIGFLVAEEMMTPQVIKAMMWHDVTEAITGDIPAPTKWDYPRLELALKEVEADLEEIYGLAVKLTDNEIRLKKFCDLMELALFAIEEFETGNKRMLGVYENAMKAIIDRNLLVTAKAAELCDQLAKHYRNGVYGVATETICGWPRRKKANE